MKHIIEFFPGDWVDQMSRINEAVIERNKLQKLGGQTRLVRKISNMEFWKFIECIISRVTHAKKVCIIWGEIYRFDAGKVPISIYRHFCGIFKLNVHC